MFPSNPNVGDRVTLADGRIFEWTGERWALVSGGGGDGGGTVESYVHTETPAHDTWVILHNMNSRYVLVQVVNTSGNTVIPDVEYTNANRTDLIFDNPVEGTAIIRR